MNEQKSKWPHHNKTIVVKMAGRYTSKYPHLKRFRVDGKWQLLNVEAGRIFTGSDHGEKAEKYLKKKRREYKERTTEEIHDEQGAS